MIRRWLMAVVTIVLAVACVACVPQSVAPDVATPQISPYAHLASGGPGPGEAVYRYLDSVATGYESWYLQVSGQDLKGEGFAALRSTLFGISAPIKIAHVWELFSGPPVKGVWLYRPVIELQGGRLVAFEVAVINPDAGENWWAVGWARTRPLTAADKAEIATESAALAAKSLPKAPIPSNIATGPWSPEPVKTSDYLNAVRFVDNSKGWTVGTNGAIFRTTDGGAHWRAERSGTGEDLYSVSFVDSSTGWAVGGSPDTAGHGVILKTTDGGVTWKPLRSKMLQTPTSVFFVDHDNGWAAGGVYNYPSDGDSATSIQRTTDGGKNWTTVYTAGESATTAADEPLNQFSCLFFTSKSNGWAVGARNTILATYDGGLTWAIQYSAHSANGSSRFDSVAFADSENGLAVGTSSAFNALVARTQDGGRHWVLVKLPSGAAARGLSSVSFGDARHAWILASGMSGQPAILRSSDGGLSWQAEAVPHRDDLNLNAVFALGGTSVWAVGESTTKSGIDTGAIYKRDTALGL